MGPHVRRDYAPLQNPVNPFTGTDVDWEEPPQDIPLQVIEEHAKTILTRNDSPDVGFDWGINPYRGCRHGCVYCYARRTHEFLDMSAGRDFEQRIIVKVNAPELLDRELRTKRWRGDVIAMSGNTDVYQPLEADWRLTRRCLEVCAAFQNPVTIITKSHLVTRDIDVLTEIHARSFASVTLSIPFLDRELCRVIEPFAPPPERRFDAIRRLSEAGIPVTVNVAPIIPGLNDADVAPILTRAAEAGAVGAGYICLRLPGTVRAVFEAAIRERLPLRAARILNRVREVRGGKMNEAEFTKRMRGAGQYWDTIEHMFHAQCRRLGLNQPAWNPPRASTFRIPTAQQELPFLV